MRKFYDALIDSSMFIMTGPSGLKIGNEYWLALGCFKIEVFKNLSLIFKKLVIIKQKTFISKYNLHIFVLQENKITLTGVTFIQ